MSIEVVFAKSMARVSLDDGRVANVRKGQHWPATDPVVRIRPDLFTSDPRYGLVYTEAPPGHDTDLNEVGDVEYASAVPGERRSVRRRG